MKRKQLYDIIRTPESAYQYAISTGILNSQPPYCDACGEEMTFEKGQQRCGLSGRFRCKNPCRKSKSLLYNSIFNDSKLSLNKSLEFMYFYAEKKNVRESAYELDLNKSSVQRWLKKLEQAVENSTPNNDDFMFKNNNIYEVDECHLHVNRNDHKRILRSQKYWVVDIFDRNPRKIKLTLTRRRNM